jgi:hypothetical protein
LFLVPGALILGVIGLIRDQQKRLALIVTLVSGAAVLFHILTAAIFYFNFACR